MPIIIFAIDTSASMNQRSYLGTSHIDTAKSAVENFLRIRQRDNEHKKDRYMLLTTEEPPYNIKAGWKENQTQFLNELKNLQAFDLSNMGIAMKQAFDLLTANRLSTGIDTYGQGRFPFYFETTIVIVITDSGKLTSSGGVLNELTLPMNGNILGSELTQEPFRWDQRLFTLVLQLPAVPPVETGNTFIPSAGDSPVDAMCEVTGGRSYAVTSARVLMQCIESINQKICPGVVVNFEKVGSEALDAAKNGADDDESQQPWYRCRKMICIPRNSKNVNIGHWPIPEAYWPDPNATSFPPRTAHPTIKFACTAHEVMMVDNIPFDKYELEPSPLTQNILERRQPNVCWQVFVTNSAKYSDIGHPFGYLKPSSNLTTVNLIVLPYNYPVILPLLDELVKSPNSSKPSEAWKAKFNAYLKLTPMYYSGPLKKLLSNLKLPNLIPQSMENYLSYSMISYLKKVKEQGNIENQRLISLVGKSNPAWSERIVVEPRNEESLLQRPEFGKLIKSMRLQDASALQHQIKEFSKFHLFDPLQPKFPSQSYRNPFDVQRQNLLDQIARMRANLFQSSLNAAKLIDDDQVHSVPVQQMGNYQEYLKRMPEPLREIESAPVRQHMFGNPFKVNKSMFADEVDELSPNAGQAKNNKRPADAVPVNPKKRCRRKGPLSVDFQWPPSPMSSSDGEASDMESDIEEVASDLEEVSSNDGSRPTSPQPSETSDLTNHHDHLPPDEEQVPDDSQEGQESDDMSNGKNAPCEDELKQLNGHMKVPVVEHAECRMDNSLSQDDYYRQLKISCFKEVRKPGNNHSQLFSLLHAIEGDLAAKQAVVDSVIREAGRFKRLKLIEMLEALKKQLVERERSKYCQSKRMERPPGNGKRGKVVGR